MEDKGEIIVYQTEEKLQLDVIMLDETVWLTQQQMSLLFGRERSVITRHVSNIFAEHELEENSNVHFLHIALADRPVKYYSLDVIISVGYRVKSLRGTQFRQWANKVLKDYLLRGVVINQRIEKLEKRVQNVEHNVDFFIKTTLPPIQGVFYDGQIFDAYVFVSKLIKKADYELILIDNYVDETVLTLLDKRKENVSATIYTRNVSPQLSLDLAKHNAQYPPIEIVPFNKAHDRFFMVDNDVYHLGASLKDLGKKWFAFSLIKDLAPETIKEKITYDP